MAGSAKDSKIMELKDTISQLNTVIENQNELVMSLRSTVDECNATIAGLRGQVEYLTKKLFGTKSEKTKNIEGQLSLFNEAEVEASNGKPESEKVVVKEHTRQAKRTSDEIFKGVPSRDEVIPLDEEQKHCADCGAEMEVIGKEFVRREFRFIPAKGGGCQHLP